MVRLLSALTKKLHVLLLQQTGDADTGLHGQKTDRVLKYVSLVSLILSRWIARKGFVSEVELKCYKDVKGLRQCKEIVTYITNLLVLRQVDEHRHKVALEVVHLHHLGKVTQLATCSSVKFYTLELFFCKVSYSLTS